VCHSVFTLTSNLSAVFCLRMLHYSSENVDVIHCYIQLHLFDPKQSRRRLEWVSIQWSEVTMYLAVVLWLGSA
jgi:hypothetical protein